MRAFPFLFLVLAFPAVAGFDGLLLKNLNLNYQRPYGKGDVEKIGINFSTKARGSYPVEIHRKETTLELTSPFVDVVWNKPWGFVHEIEGLGVSTLNANFGKREHTASVKSVSVEPIKDKGVFELGDVLLKCAGSSSDAQIENRLLDDCRESLRLTVATLEVPMDFFMAKLVMELPLQEPMSVSDRPLDSLVLTSEKGDFSFQVYTRLVFYAGLRAWGHLSYENERKTIVIRIDQVKFGYIPITAIVLRELKKRINHPDVTITGNTIRINLPKS